MDVISPPELHKLCVRCSNYLPFNMFYTCRKGKNGLYSYCKKCQNAQNLAYYHKNSKKINQLPSRKLAHKKYMASEKGQLTKKKYIESGRAAKVDREAIKRNPGKNAEACKAWRERNPEKWEAAQARRKVKLRLAALGQFENVIYKMVKDAALKGKKLDHIVPISGKNVCGLNVPWNTQEILESENRYKRNWFDAELYEIWRKSGEIGPFLRPPE